MKKLLTVIVPKTLAKSSFIYQVIDLNGMILVENHKLQSKQQLQTIDVSVLKQGMYVLRVTGNGITQTIKFIKN